ncbi:hypothetical protein HUU05_07810, partial [candidate division KSB1 bacterium]|nr:hypothetical protein [candidate division KSB1 bacterium]
MPCSILSSASGLFHAALSFILLMNAALIAQSRWEEKISLPGGGGQVAVEINPHNPNTVYAAGGVFAISRDRGETWTTTSLPANQINISTITVHPGDTNTIFIGGFNTGVMKSIDSGQSWTTVLHDVGFNGRSIVVDPFHPDTLHAGSLRHGLYSSYDRGQTWFASSTTVISFCCLAIRSDSSNVLLGGTFQNAGIHKSSDFGKTWRLVAKREAAEVPVIVFDPDIPNQVYATVYGTSADEGVLVSGDGGETWSSLESFNGGETWSFAVNPSAPNILLSGGFSRTAGSSFYSKDRGRSWCTIKEGLPSTANTWMMAISPNHNAYVAANEAGSNRGAVFKLVNTQAPPNPPQRVQARETGTGHSALVSWQPSEICSAPIALYRILYGQRRGVYTDSVEAGPSLQALVTGLQEGVLHYLTAVALDNMNRRSAFAVEITFTPRSAPFAPQALAARHGLLQAKLYWRQNEDLDLAGYHVYRSASPIAGFAKLNSALLVDTTYVDYGLSSARYYYKVTAVDSTGLESPASNILSYRPIALERGVLLIDETRDGNGSQASPSDAQVDDYYQRLLASFEFSEYDARKSGAPYDTLGLYRALVWHHDDPTNSAAPGSREFMADYLAAGGKLLLSGWNVMGGFMLGAVSRTFTAGDFAFDYLQIDTTWKTSEVQFAAATAVAPNYNDVHMDSLKAPIPQWNGLLRDVYVFAPSAGAKVLFNYSARDRSYLFHNKPIGFSSSRHEVVVLGMPLYFMQEEEARAA